ncbi:hydroxyisourate hydrolase [Salicibibacter cibarius]|uniref:5-hydroxyisourate hydrolase n=1 Tax=Salicibibacter cibarius TaxID=2743000 RepID=A0A7T6Z6E6_9BACI|nr:hydroxyisourate hydrolase [Salicibibacter cibarius]QQK77231.1 hydroxyisourate hydrolase [Salicibibacter cibarius]
MAGHLTTHVLDISASIPAQGLTIELWRLSSTSDRTHVKTVVTNDDGRVDNPLLADDDMQQGTYELVFHAGDYFKKRDVTTDHPPFLNDVPVRFNVADSDAHYHVPLLVAPGGYSTYRGS